MADEIRTPLERIADLEGDVSSLQGKVDKADPISPRMLALVTVLCLLIVTGLLGAMKALSVEVIAAILGAVAGRLTSNIGGTSNGGQSK